MSNTENTNNMHTDHTNNPSQPQDDAHGEKEVIPPNPTQEPVYVTFLLNANNLF